VPNLTGSDYLQLALRPLRRTARYWWVALGALLLGVGATFLVADLRDKEYKSEAVVLYQEGLQWNPGEGVSTRRIGQRLRDMMLARAQLAKIIEELGLYPRMTKSGRAAEAVEEMRAHTTFKVSEGDIFVISFTGETPFQAQRVTQRLTDVLIGENTRLRSEQAEVARAFLDAEKKRNERDLSAKEAAQLRFLAQHPEFAHEQSSIAVVLHKKPEGGPLPEKGGDTALQALRREEERLRRQIRSPGKIPRAVDQALVDAKSEAERKLKAAQRELADRQARFTEQHPDVRSAAALVKDAEDALRRASDALAAAEAAAPPVVVETPEALQARLTQVQAEIAAYQRRQQKNPDPGESPEEPVESSDAAQRIVALESEWARLSREVTEARERFEALDTKQFMASMTASTLLSGQAATIVVIDPAFEPAKPIGMSSTRFFLMGILAALGLGLGLAVICALVDDRVYDAADIARLELAPVLVEVSAESLEEAA